MNPTTEQELYLLDDEIEAKGIRLLFAAAKHGKLDLVKKQIARGIDVNSSDHDQNLPIDYAWKNKFYDVVLLLLEADSKFPKVLNLAHLDDESAKKLKYFVDERNALHRYIEEGNLQEVQKLVNKRKSKFYFNDKNQTAASVANKTQNWDILAFFLNSIGVEFFNEQEKRELDKLELQHKVELTGAMVPNFPPVSNSHIWYLISKSKSQKPVESLKDKLQDFYRKLDEIPEISMILKMIQHSDYLDIVFDFDNEHVNGVNLLSSKNTRGETNYKEGRLYIAASPKRGNRKILGTIAHEITHMAMQVLFENECNPYLVNDKNGGKHFEKTTRDILNQIKNIKNNPSEVIYNVKSSYEKKDHPSELIVTVPQILVEYENGREWLQNNVQELFDFFANLIIPKCQEYVNKSPILKVINTVKKLNENIGEIGKLKNSNMLFRNIDRIKDFLDKQDNKIFILTTKYTFLGLVKVIQGLFGKSYINLYDKYFAFNYKKFIPHMTEIMKTFYLDACNTLIIQGVDDPFDGILEELLDITFEIFEHKPCKKVIFVINPNVEETLFEKLKDKNLLNSCISERDSNSSLNDLTEESKTKILSIKVQFQGKKIRLRKLLGSNENSHKLITGDAIENIIEEKDIQIGGKIFSSSNMEANFAYIDKNINLETLMYEFKESDSIFVLKGLKEKCELMYHFKEFTSKGLIQHQAILNQIQIIDSQCYEINNKRLILSKEMSSESFKEFCHCNCRKKIYLIAVAKDGEEIKFTLQQLYNPNFYLQRKFKIMINKYQLEKLISECKSECFILSDSTIFDKTFQKRYPNVKILDEIEAESKFDACVKKQKMVHWYHAKYWNEIYFKACKRLDFRELKTNDELLIAEKDMINHTVNEKVIIIADNPGMGKSTTLTKLYESPVIADTHWVIRLNLKELIMSIKKISSKTLNVETLIYFLQLIEPNFRNELTQAWFRSALTLDGTLSIAVLFVFDGFDEILDDDIRTTIISLIKYLKNDTRSKIWITTRLHYKDVLEDTLSTFAFQFEPIDEQSKRIYLQTYLQDRLKLIFERERTYDIFDLKDNSKMLFYTDKFLQHMNLIFTENVSTFIGTPLQLYLMMENSVEHFKNWIDQNTPVPDFSYLGNNILKVFENFIDRKYEIFFKKQNILEDIVRKKERENADEYHEALAESLIQNTALSKKHENGSPLAFLIGLIQSHDGKHVEFIHYTFREFFVALSVIKNILIKSSNLGQKSKHLIDILEKAEYKVVKNFLDVTLESINLVEVPKDNIEYFIKNLILSPTLIDGSSECRVPQSLTKIFNRTLEERNKNILEFMVFCCECYLPEPLCVDLLQALNSTFSRNGVFYWIVYHNDVHIFEILHKLIKKMSLESKRKIMYENITNLMQLDLHNGIRIFSSSHGMQNIHYKDVNKCQVEVVKILLANFSEIFSVEEQKQFISTMNGDKVYKSVFHLIANRGNTELLKIWLSKSKELLSAKEHLMQIDSSSRTILHAATEGGSRHFLKHLLREMNEILLPNEQRDIIMKRGYLGQNVLQYAAERKNTKVMNILLNASKKLSSAKELLMNQNRFLETAFHSATGAYKSKNLLNLIRAMNEILPTNEQRQMIKKPNENGYNVLHYAIFYRCTKSMNIWIKKSKEIFSTKEQRQILMKRDKDGNNVLHLAAERKKTTKLISMLLNESKKLSLAKRLLMHKNSSSKTVLHLVTEYGSPNLLNLLIREMNEILSENEHRKILMKRDKNGNNVLHLAAGRKTTKLLSILLNESKKLSSAKELLMHKNSSSKTVLHFATEYGNPDLLNLLIREMNEILSANERRQILMKRDKNGNNVLHLAAGRKKTIKLIISILLKESKKLSSAEELLLNKNSSSKTVLHLVSKYGSPDLLNFFAKEIIKILSTNKQRQYIE